MLTIQITKPLYGITADMTLDIDLTIEQGSFVALSGVSGSGKTTLLRVLAGLEEAEGEIGMGETAWLHRGKALPPQKRGVGMLFQSYALFPHMSVEENLLYVSADKALAEQLMEMTGLTALRERKPQSLSGGQQQRVALCRAMMGRPQLLLLDEPLSALDPVMRAALQQEILSLHREFGTTTLMVSHEPSEIYRMAERVVVLEQGCVIADGSPREVLLRTTGSQKFSFEGEILEMVPADVVVVAIIAIGQQIVEIVIGTAEASSLSIGDRVSVSTKAFAPTLSKMNSKRIQRA
jgi:molybdate transport system ATP-binding protein